MRSRHRILWFALVAALCFGAAACGGDDDDLGGLADDGGSGGQSEDDIEDTAEDVLNDELGGDCGFLAQFAGLGLDSAFDPAAAASGNLGETFSALASEFQEVADAAPGEIEDAFQTMADGVAQMAEAFGDIDFSDPSSIDPEALSAFENGPGEEFEAASDEVEAWIQENCAGVGG